MRYNLLHSRHYIVQCRESSKLRRTNPLVSVTLSCQSHAVYLNSQVRPKHVFPLEHLRVELDRHVCEYDNHTTVLKDVWAVVNEVYEVFETFLLGPAIAGGSSG